MLESDRGILTKEEKLRLSATAARAVYGEQHVSILNPLGYSLSKFRLPTTRRTFLIAVMTASLAGECLRDRKPVLTPSP